MLGRHVARTNSKGGDSYMINITTISFKHRIWNVLLAAAKLIDGTVYLGSITLLNTCYFEKLMLSKWHERLYKAAKKS